MSGFGGGGRYNSSNNYRGGGGSGRNNNYRGGNRNHGRGNRNQGRGLRSGYGPKLKCLLSPCHDFMPDGNCPRGASCHFTHVIRRHASIEATNQLPQKNNYNNYNNNFNNNNKQSRLHALTGTAIWQVEGGAIKIFTGSTDGFWRLWNTAGGQFVKEFEANMNGPVECLEVASNYLFCAFEAAPVSLPNAPVGMIHAWNLQNPGAPPLEFHMHRLSPFAHSTAVTCLKVMSDGMIFSGDKAGIMRVWKFEGGIFKLLETLNGHAGKITGMEVVDNKMLWSSSADCSIRLWDLTKKGDCQFVINPAPTNNTPGGAAAGAAGLGHTKAVTGLVQMQLPNNAGTFVLSSSLDGTIKAWNGTTGECVASEDHEGLGVITMALTQDPTNSATPLLLIGCEGGNIMCHNLVQTPKAAAFALIFNLYAHTTHSDDVLTIRSGPQGTFYTGGKDGTLKIWQIVDSLGLH